MSFLIFKNGGVTSSNGQYHVNPTDYLDVLSTVENNKPVEVTLPDVTVKAADPKNYRSSYDPNGFMDFMNTVTLGVGNRFSVSQNARLVKDIYDASTGNKSWEDVVNSAVLGNNGIFVNPYANMALDIVVPTVGGKYRSIANATAEGAEKVTGYLNRNMGYWGDNLLSRTYGTTARRWGLPTTSKIPETYRALGTVPDVTADGKISLYPTARNKFRAEQLGEEVPGGHANFTTDRKVTGHGSKFWQGNDVWIVKGKNLINENTKGVFRSVEPSDMFTEGMPVENRSFNPKDLTVVTGNPETISWANEHGVNVMTDSKLQELYKKSLADESSDIFARDDFRAYDKYQRQLMAKRGRPTKGDYKKLEELTGLPTGTASKNVEEETMSALKKQQKAGNDETSLTYPNNRAIGDISRAQRFNAEGDYGNVYYDPATNIEYLYKKWKVDPIGTVDKYGEQLKSYLDKWGKSSVNSHAYGGSLKSNEDKWLEVTLQGNKKHGYVLVNNKNKPVLFNSDSGYFRVYDSPNTQSHYYNTYLEPTNKSSKRTVNDNNPVQLKEVQITTSKKPTEFVGIQRTPDDHLAALARDRAVDAKVNPLNDLLQSFFANLMTGGMYSAVDLGTKNLAKGNYLEGAVQTATPIMFGPAESTVANLTRLGVGAYDLLSKNGVLKTYNLAKLGNWSGAAKSAAGDALNLGMTLGGGYNLGKEYNFSKYVSPKTLYLSYKLNTKSPKYFYGFNDDKNLVNKFLGNSYFHLMHADKILNTRLEGVNNLLWWDKHPFYGGDLRLHYTFVLPKSEMSKYKIGTGDVNGIVTNNSKSYPITSNMNLSDMLLIKPAYSSKDKITPLNVTLFGNLNSKIKEGVNELQLIDTPTVTESVGNTSNALNHMLHDQVGVAEQYVYPNGRAVGRNIDSINNELTMLKQLPYNNVFYDPASHVEFNWRQAIGPDHAYERMPKKANGGRVLMGQQGTNSAWSALYHAIAKKRGKLTETAVKDTVNYAIQRGKELNIPYEFTRSLLSNAVQESGLIHNARNGSHYGLIQATWIPRNYNAKQQIDMIYDMALNPAKYKDNRVLGYEANLLNKSYRNPSTRNFFNWTERAGVGAWNAAPRNIYDSAFDSYYKSVYTNPESTVDYVSLHTVELPDALRVAKPVILPSLKLGGLLRFISFKKGGKLRKNDKGETVPEICPKCGGKIGVFLQGEPIFKCTKCGKYFGVVPFSKGK